MIRLFGHYVSKTFLTLGILEFVLSLLSLVAGYHVRLGGENVSLTEGQIWVLGAVYALMMSVSMLSMGMYQRGLPLGTGALLRLVLSFAFTSMGVSVLFYSLPDLFLGRGVMGLALLFTLVGILVLRGVFFRIVGEEERQHRVLVFGAGSKAALIEELLDQEAPGFRVIGYLSGGEVTQGVPDSRLIAYDKPLMRIVEEHEIDELVIAPDDRRNNLPVDDVLDCKMSGIVVLDLATFFEKETSRVKLDVLHPSWIFFSRGFRIGGLQLYNKRMLDLVVGAILLVPGLPLMLLVALAIMIESGGKGSVLFHQTRVGLNGRFFRVHKFRSMRMDAESDGVARWASKNDSRITRVGAIIRKARLDELPQIFNVLRGEMSLVGPRPERPEFVERLTEEIPYYRERHRVKPGLTGWAQLCYQYGSTTEDAKHKLEFDLYYVKNASFFLDMIVLIETVEVVLWGKGAH